MHTMMGKKVALLLFESIYDACSLSLSPRRRKGQGGVRPGDAEDEQLTFL